MPTPPVTPIVGSEPLIVQFNCYLGADRVFFVRKTDSDYPVGSKVTFQASSRTVTYDFEATMDPEEPDLATFVIDREDVALFFAARVNFGKVFYDSGTGSQDLLMMGEIDCVR